MNWSMTLRSSIFACPHEDCRGRRRPMTRGCGSPRNGAAFGCGERCDPSCPYRMMSARRRPCLAVAEKMAGGFAGFTLDLLAFRTPERLLAALGSHQRLVLDLLLGGHCEQPARSLTPLKPPSGP